jgi:arylesterase/paraoxonase
MKKALLIVLVIILSVTSFVGYTFYSTGFFREILPKGTDNIIQKVPLPGVEDMAIDREGQFIILSSDDRAGRRDGSPRQGGLYLLRLDGLIYTPVLLSQNFKDTFYPHGISMLKLTDEKYRIWAINHVNGKHSIEVFDLFNADSLVHVETMRDELMISPNDVVALSENELYYTNDHGNTSNLGILAENYLGVRASNVVHAKNGIYRIVAEDIAYANGINYDPNRSLMFVASPRDFIVKVYNRAENGDLVFAENIDTGTGVDNIEFDREGALWIGCHPSLLSFTSYAAGKKPYSASEVIKISYDGTGDYTQETLYLDDGANMAAATVAPFYEGKVFVGNVMDDHFLILDLNE